MLKNTIKLFYNDIPITDIVDDYPDIIISNNSCFDEVKKYKDGCIHNFANNDLQGGPCCKFTYDGNFISQSKSSNTQEDQLVRIYKDNIILPKNMYPICTLNNEALLYSTCGLLHPVITLPSIVQPNLKNKNVRTSLVKRLILIMYVCKFHTLITGLWGCGAFGMNPCDLVEIWREALKKSKHRPKKIVFCIIIDEYSKCWKDKNIVKEFEKLINI